MLLDKIFAILMFVLLTIDSIIFVGIIGVLIIWYKYRPPEDCYKL